MIRVLLLCLILVGCATTSQNEKRELRLRVMAQEIRDEKEVGRQMAAKLLGHLGEYRASPTLQRYVELVGQGLVDRVGRPELQYRFGVLSSKEVNAFATPGGFIFVTKGLLSFLRTEEELAAVLAHEIAHVNERHMYREIMPKRNVNASEVVVRLMSRGGSDLGGSISQIVNKGLNLLLEKGLSEDMETKADEAALFYLAQVGYAPPALLALRTRLYEGKKKVNEQEVPRKRLTFIKKVLADHGLYKTSSNNETILKSRFNRSLASLSGK